MMNRISDNFLIDEATIDKLCLITTVFVKFNVSKNGNLINLDFTKNTPALIKEALEKAMKSTDGDWQFSKSGKKKYNTSFILPVVLFYETGCREGTNGLALNTTAERRQIEYRNLDDTARKGNYAVMDILDFKDGRISELQCILLSPLTFSANRD